jgi:hypothetical protein
MPRKAVLALVAALSLSVGATLAQGADSATPADLREIRREIQRIKQHERDEEQRIQSDKARDDKLIQALEQRVQVIENQNLQLKSANSELQAKLQEQTESTPPASQFAQAFQQYLGSRTFQVAGAAGVSFIYDKQSSALSGMAHQSANTFTMDWEPLILYRPLDWILFEAEFDGAFAPDGSTGVTTPLMDFHIFLNDYMEIVAGLFDQPFGDWYESQSPMWVNRFITAPLPFGAEPVIPPSEMGLQFRGGLQWGGRGQDFDYTLWTGNGPSFSAPVPGAALNGVTGVATSKTNGRSFGARLRFYPLPLDANLGRLEVGTSTVNGKWFDGKWYDAWGLDFSYFRQNLRMRGEWMSAYRQMPGAVADNRQGWYLQAGYSLNRFTLPFLPDEVNQFVQRLEPLIRYSGVNQRAVVQEDVGAFPGFPQVVGANIPDFAFNGSPALFAPHSREVAFGLDYWIAPSIVWKNELDFELPRAGGLLTSATGGPSVPVGATPNDVAFLSQFTVGF